MTLEQRLEYAAILHNPPYPNNRESLFRRKGDGSCTVCAIGALYCVKVQDPFRSMLYLTTDECSIKLSITADEQSAFMRNNYLGGYQAVIDWLLTGLDISRPKEPHAPSPP